METKGDNLGFKEMKKYVLLFAVLILCAGSLAGGYMYKRYAAYQLYKQELRTDVNDLRKKVERLSSERIDWNAAQSIYEEENKRLEASQNDQRRIVFIGDSITQLWSAPENGDFFSGNSYINRGISGQTTAQILLRFRLDVVKLHPKVVVILAGITDIVRSDSLINIESVEDNLASMTELAKSNDIRIVLASLLPVNDMAKNENREPVIRTGKTPIDKIKALNSWIKDYAGRNNFTYLDYYSAMADNSGFLNHELSDDGIHPNSKGYSVMKPLAENAIEIALKNKAK